VRYWTHHVRAHNKMADSLANLAMDTRTSSQVLHPMARSGHALLTAHLSNDLSTGGLASLFCLSFPSAATRYIYCA
jgi:hypothetical protein